MEDGGGEREGKSRAALPEVSLEGLRVVVEQRIDQPKQLHHPLILPQVLVALQKEHEVTPVAPWGRGKRCGHVCPPPSPSLLPPSLTLKDQLPGPLFGGDDVECGGHSANVDHWLVGLVGARHGQLQVL